MLIFEDMSHAYSPKYKFKIGDLQRGTSWNPAWTLIEGKRRSRYREFCGSHGARPPQGELLIFRVKIVQHCVRTVNLVEPRTPL